MFGGFSVLNAFFFFLIFDCDGSSLPCRLSLVAASLG